MIDDLFDWEGDSEYENGSQPKFIKIGVLSFYDLSFSF